MQNQRCVLNSPFCAFPYYCAEEHSHFYCEFLQHYASLLNFQNDLFLLLGVSRTVMVGHLVHYCRSANNPHCTFTRAYPA